MLFELPQKLISCFVLFREIVIDALSLMGR